MFGKIVPKDVYQECLLDSFNTNKVTLVGGPAGSGKTFMSLGYLFYLLEKGEIDRIVIFCNPVVAKNAAKLGFYPGTVLEKLLSTQVGAVLSSKLGDITEVERLVNQGSLVLMPAGDSRGYEVPAHSGVYIMESQNLDIVLLRMILQRIGEDCITIVDGDREEQTDMEIYANDNNGMARMSEVFKGSKIFGQVDLKYIYRSEIASIADYM
jgi:predicted ribonuclease YlaK